MNMQTSAQASAPATERPTAPVRGPEGRNGDGQPVAQQAGPVPQQASPSAPPESEPEPTREWAICCSGGGIRSATYCLGGLQSLDERGPLGKAEWIGGAPRRRLHRAAPGP